MTTLVWCRLEAELEPDRTTVISGWLEAKPGVHPGAQVTLLDSHRCGPEQLWDVMEVGRPTPSARIRSTWKVGGL